MSYTNARLGLLALMPWLALQGCGGPQVSDPSESKESRVDYLDWCESWGLECPTTIDPLPSPDNQWSAAQWRSAFAMVKGVASSAGAVRIDRSELDSADLEAALRQLGSDDILQQIKERLDANAFSSVSLDRGGLIIMNERASDYQTNSGLSVHTGEQVKVNITEQLSFAVTGLEFSGPSGASETLRDLAVNSPNVMEVAGGETTVTGVPIKFLFKELAGIHGSNGDSRDLSYQQFVPALAPLSRWLTTGKRDVDLSGGSFALIAEHLPNVVSDRNLGQALGQALSRVSRLRSTAATRHGRLVQVEASRRISCEIKGQASLTFESQFGVQSLTPHRSGGATVRLYGITAKPATGLIRPTIRLGRIDLEPTRVVIHDVPVVGTYVIDMTGGSQQDVRMSCR